MNSLVPSNKLVPLPDRVGDFPRKGNKRQSPLFPQRELLNACNL